MRKRAFLLSLLFAILGGGAAFVALTHATNGAQQSTAHATQVDNVLVPMRAIEVGARISASDVQLTPLLHSLAPTDALHDAAEVDGRYATTSLVPGQPLRRGIVSETPPGSRLAAVIPDGQVAVSVAVSDVISISGFVTPGDHVDVLGVISKEPKDDAQVVLRDVLVLAVSDALNADQAKPVDAKASATANKNPTGVDSTITVAVTIQEAQRLVQVDEVGKLRLALRRRDAGDVAFSQR